MSKAIANDPYGNDAFKKLLRLYEENTREWLPRPDLKVEALGCDRNVRLSLGTPVQDPLDIRRYSWHSTQRNVSTFRELAEAILAACDFVEAVNPAWASHLTHEPAVRLDR